MAPGSATAAVLFHALAVALTMAMALQLSAAAAAAAPPPPAPIGKPGCETTCGNVSVPYPFGISPGCFWPGLNLTCDKSHGAPRLLLGDGSLRVTSISLKDTTVRVMRTGPIIKGAAGDGDSISAEGWTNASFGLGFTEHGYLLDGGNELVVLGCNVVAMLFADGAGVKAPGSIAGCASLCSKAYGSGDDFFIDSGDVLGPPGQQQCTGTKGCCQSSVTTAANPPNRVQAKRLYTGSDAMEEMQAPVNVFVAETGWIQQIQQQPVQEIPFLLGWSVTQGVRPRPQRIDDALAPCDDDVRRKLCKSQHSVCSNAYQAPGYTCQCEGGYDGNPYLAGPGGCQDIDECKLSRDETGCLGECTNTIGSMECRCPHGTFGNPSARGGCVEIKSNRDALLPTVAPVPFSPDPKCKTTCGDVRVPYPFGIGPAAAGCSLPGFNLTCDTSYHPPRLLLDGNGTLEVVNISLANSTVHVIHHGSITSTWTELEQNNNNSDTETTVYHDIPHIREPYTLSTTNQFILAGCNVQGTLYGDGDSIISSCNSTCRSSRNDYTINKGNGIAEPLIRMHSNGGYCSGRDDGCCHAPIAAGSSTPKRMGFKALNLHPRHEWIFFADAYAFISSEDGLTNQSGLILNRTAQSFFRTNYMLSSPLVLRWAVKQGVTALPGNSSGQRPGDIASNICKSKDSFCRQENGGFTCHCNTGYQGSPYIADGCKDVDECSSNTTRPCFGDCENLPGTFKCQCQGITFGNPYKRHGCVGLSTILSTFIKENKIGLSATSGPVLLLLVLGIMLVPRKIQEHRMKVLKQKYFKQNRGQLLQQLMSQKTDIAERMIISMEELAKATNNFDKTRELGGGGHGTVYKGILSDQHVVAIKKSKITVQKEIDEFINEVAILSQVNHKNIVKLFGCCLETEVPLLVYEFISNGTLYHHLHVEGPRSLSWGNRLRIATEIASSLAYLHTAVSIPVIHRDIKSNNILLDDKMTSKISDFGASRYIPIDKTGLTTRLQGTIGYWDPIYFQTGRLTEKSDVYSFGVILVELLTRRKPFSYLTTEGDGLVSHFLDLHAERNLVQIIDPQVIEEGAEEIQEFATLAASCINFRGEERPTMRQVEHTLEGLLGSKKYKRDDTVPGELEDDSIVTNYLSTTKGQCFQESSRRYSLEQEMMMSARYPR